MARAPPSMRWMRWRPFDKPLAESETSDLERLRDDKIEAPHVRSWIRPSAPPDRTGGHSSCHPDPRGSGPRNAVQSAEPDDVGELVELSRTTFGGEESPPTAKPIRAALVPLCMTVANIVQSIR